MSRRSLVCFLLKFLEASFISFRTREVSVENGGLHVFKIKLFLILVRAYVVC